MSSRRQLRRTQAVIHVGRVLRLNLLKRGFGSCPVAQQLTGVQCFAELIGDKFQIETAVSAFADKAAVQLPLGHILADPPFGQIQVFGQSRCRQVCH